MINTKIITKGGSKLRNQLRKTAKSQNRSIHSVEVGFYSSARYPNGEYVTNVAAWNEFGTSTSPPRPYFRNANIQMRPLIKHYLSQAIDPTKMVVDKSMGGKMGQIMRNTLITSITKLRNPPNAPSTLERKFPKTNPLINTGKMRTSVTYKVNS